MPSRHAKSVTRSPWCRSAPARCAALPKRSRSSRSSRMIATWPPCPPQNRPGREGRSGREGPAEGQGRLRASSPVKARRKLPLCRPSMAGGGRAHAATRSCRPRGRRTARGPARLSDRRSDDPGQVRARDRAGRARRQRASCRVPASSARPGKFVARSNVSPRSSTILIDETRWRNVAAHKCWPRAMR